jgi:hypothetical protein
VPSSQALFALVPSYDPYVGYSVFLQRFIDGDAGSIDGVRLKELLNPWIVDLDDDFAYARLRMLDMGEADVYGVNKTNPFGCTFSRFSYGDVVDLMVRLAQELDMVIMPPDRPLMLTREEQRRHLPDGFAEEAILVHTGTDVQRVINPGSVS